MSESLVSPDQYSTRGLYRLFQALEQALDTSSQLEARTRLLRNTLPRHYVTPRRDGTATATSRHAAADTEGARNLRIPPAPSFRLNSQLPVLSSVPPFFPTVDIAVWLGSSCSSPLFARDSRSSCRYYISPALTPVVVC